MSLSSRFNDDLCDWLKKEFPSYDWRHEFPVGDLTKERVDVGGEPDKHGPTVLIEAELKREDPASNILKVWNQLVDEAYPSGVLLVQGFSGVYRSPKHHTRGVRYVSAKRLGKLIEKNQPGKFVYLPLDIPYFPRAGSREGNGARRKWARWFATRIARELFRRGLPK